MDRMKGLNKYYINLDYNNKKEKVGIDMCNV